MYVIEFKVLFLWKFKLNEWKIIYVCNNFFFNNVLCKIVYSKEKKINMVKSKMCYLCLLCKLRELYFDVW